MVAEGGVRVEKLVYGGSGLARVDGLVTIVPFVLPGELVDVAPVRRARDLVAARLVGVLEAAPERTQPACPYFMRCGGCHYQHSLYDHQPGYKRAILEETLRRIGKITPPATIEVIAGPGWEYRNRSRFHVQRRQIGYLESGSRRLCAVERCPVSSPRINEALACIRDFFARARFPEFVAGVEVFTNERDVQIFVETGQSAPGFQVRAFRDRLSERVPGAVSGSLDYAAAGETFRVSAGSFFQVNRFLIDQLVEAAIGGTEGEDAIDVYAGVGLFTIPLARRFRQVTAVEGAIAEYRDLEANASRAGVEVSAVHSSAELFLDRIETRPDLLVADPPRMGLGPRVVRQLARILPRRLVLVSCDPATLSRDLAGLVQSGYRIERATMIDLFPQTYHIETVVHLESSS